MVDRDEFLTVGRSLTLPTLVVIGEQSPPQSKAEMEALATLSNIESVRSLETLGLHEEYASEVAAIVLSFLRA